MEQQTPVTPPPPPQIQNEARRAKTRHFSILDLGGGGSGFSIVFVQDCNLFTGVAVKRRLRIVTYVHRIQQKNKATLCSQISTCITFYFKETHLYFAKR